MPYFQSDELDLDAIKKRETAAHRGPWIKKHQLFSADRTPAFSIEAEDGYGVAMYLYPGQADFITHARTDIPALVQEVEQLRQMNKGLASIVGDMAGLAEKMLAQIKSLAP